MHSPPAWSMGKAQRGTWKAGGQPGPGSYAPKLANKPRALGGKQGTASREVKRRNSVPGPGSYNSPGKMGTKSPEYSIAKKYPSNLKSSSPGPGTYEGTGQRGYDTTSPQYSFRVKPTESGKEKGPGPGAYEPTSKIRNTTSPSYKMGSAERDDFYPNSNAPGPGAYNTVRPDSAGPKIGFGTSNRDKQAKSDAPGPGAYEFKGFFEEDAGKGTSLVPRRESRPTTKAPGPGAYEPNLSTKNAAPSYRMGSAKRGYSAERSDAPGPGNYDPRSPKGHQNVKIGTSVRSPLSETVKTPGPGSYDYKSKVGEGPRFSMKPRRDERGNESAPGPGAYEATSRVRNIASPSYKMGTSNRDDLYRTGDTPGPGSYSTRPNSASGPKFGFGSSERDPLYGMSKTQPGPGSYDFKSDFETERGTTLVPRRDGRPNTAHVPGPGAYEPSLGTKNSAPAYRMGTASRDGARQRSGTPGPGNYNPQLAKGSQTVRIGTSVRSPLSEGKKTPGPGSYDFASKVGEGPRFSMKPRRSERYNEYTPGPGSYEATSRIRNVASPSYKMGSASRDDFYRTGDAPGPGAYTTRPGSAAGPKFGFGTSERDPLYGMSKTLPGPGSYEQHGGFEGDGKGVSMAPRRPDSALNAAAKSPGPGAYDPSLSTKNQAPAYRMGSAQRDSPTKGGAPGPGNYEPKLWQSGQNIRIGTSVRSPLSASGKNPGPGSYEPGTQIGEGPRFTMNPRRDERYDHFQPGPGAYEATSRIQSAKSPSYKMGTSNRDDLYRSNNAPGPGAYNNRPDSAGPKFGFGTADRDQHGMSKTQPGPGQYDLRGVFEDQGRGTTLVPRREDHNMKSTSKSPGPGAYNPSMYTRDQAPAYGMGSAQRDSPTKGGAPGPGNYEPKLWQSGQNVKIGTSVRSPLSGSGKNPGPGTYEYDNQAQGPKFTMNPRRDQKHDRFQPGPGAYEATSRIQNVASPSYKIGTSSRDDLYRNADAPGPGAYTTRPTSAFNKESGPKHVFGTADRDALQGMSKTLPGPGQYEHHGMFEGDGKGVSMAPRRTESGQMRSPGPGAYNPNLYTKDQAPAYRIGSAPRDSPTKGGAPGPGNYNPNLKQSGQNIRIGTSVRSPLHGNQKTPGPGTYESPTKVGQGPKYIMNPRRDEKYDRFQPGPGAYNPSVDYVKDTNPAPKMGTSNREDLYNTRANPGPGQYDTRGNAGGPRWGFGSEARSPNPKVSGPGPGAYEQKTHIGDVPKYAYGNAPLKIHL